MSMTVCIPDLISNGSIPSERAPELQRRYEQLLMEYQAKGMDRAVAETQATNRTLALLERDVLRKRVNSFKQAQAQGAWLADMRKQSGDGALSIKAATDKFIHLDKKIDTIRGRYFKTLDQLLQNHRRNLLGEVRNKEDLQLVARALFGEQVDSANAREIADAVAQTFEIARQRFNAAGGDIGRLKTFALPQRHDSRSIRAAGFDAWRAHPSIENVKVRDLESGEWAVGPKRETLLRDIYETLRTEGANKQNPGQMFMGAMANRRGDPRILHFENYDEWIAYQRDFGGGEDIYDTIAGHLGVMARDTAIMEEMGPNPSATLRFQQDWFTKAAQLDGKQADIDKVNGDSKYIERLYDELTGANRVPENRNMALSFSAVRSIQVSAKLGSAVISAITDFATLIRTAQYNDTPVMKTLGRYVSLWNPLDSGERAMAVRMGLVTDDWINLSSSSARYTGEEFTGEISRRLAEFVIRGQGLARHTRNGQWAFGMEFINHLTSMRDRSFSQLDPAMQKTMNRYGLGESDWDNYRATPTQTERGTEWIFPLNNEDVGERVLEMILTETDYGIVMPDLRTRTISGRYGAGNLPGEIFKSALLFKSFPIAVINLHGRRMMEQTSLRGKLGYAVPLGLYMIAGGALATQLGTIMVGKDPLPMDDRKFWGKAIFRSGGLGIFGDLLSNSQNSYGGGIGQTLLGPILGQTVPNFSDAIAGNIGRAIDGDEKTKPEFAKDIFTSLEKEAPLRNLWYSRLIWERLIADSIRELVDPNAAKAYNRMEQRAEQEGTQYFARPGQGLGNVRAPDLANAINGEVPN